MTNTPPWRLPKLPTTKTPNLPDLGETIMIKTKGTRFTEIGKSFAYVRVIDVDEQAGCFMGEAIFYSQGKYFTSSQWLLPKQIHKRIKWN
jgi:hypothetical protein